LPTRARLAFGALWAAALIACASPPPEWEQEKDWATRLVTPTARLDGYDRPSPDPEPGEAYNLFIAVDSVGISFESAETFLDTLWKHPRGNKKEGGVGHAWVMLETPTDFMEFGHTGEYGVMRPTYYDGFMKKVHEGDPNPASYFFESLPDGRYHEGSSGHEPTYVVRIPIDAAAYTRIRSFMDGYDFETFSLSDNLCTDFAAGAAAEAGIHLTHRIELELPRNAWFHGRKIPMWTDPEYSRVVVAAPDLLEEDLRALVAEGVADDVTEWYRREY
jgi:hypothetical protein